MRHRTSAKFDWFNFQAFKNVLVCTCSATLYNNVLLRIIKTRKKTIRLAVQIMACEKPVAVEAELFRLANLS